MQQLMSQMRTGLAQILFVDLLNRRILMRFTDRLIRIFFAQSSLTIFDDAQITEVMRLTATVDTAAGTRHDLDKVIMCFAALHAL